jgi:hypothetical protein
MTASPSSVIASPFPKATAAATVDLPPARRRIADALRSMATAVDESRCAVTKLAQGRQAHLFSVSAPTELASEVDADDLVVKLYRGNTPEDHDAARDEFECLSRLHARLDGTTHDGWQVRIPRPLHCCERSAAIVMTHVPGHTLSRHLAQGQGLAPELLDSIARAIVSALRCYWAGEPRLYGDLILNNILCDPPTRTLCFVDPGMPEPFYLCESAPLFCYPASRDLGFLLYWTASLIRPSIAHPVLHARQKRMTVAIVQRFLEGFTSAAQQHDAMAEVEACARVHLSRLALSPSPRGVWRCLVRRAAAGTIQRILNELRVTPPCAAKGSDCQW